MPTAPQPMLCRSPDRSHKEMAGPLPPSRSIASHEGDARLPRYRVVDGCLATFQTLADGSRQIIDLVGPDHLIGLGAGECNRHSPETPGLTRLGVVAEPLAASDLEDAPAETFARSKVLAMLLGRKTAPQRLAPAQLDLIFFRHIRP